MSRTGTVEGRDPAMTRELLAREETLVARIAEERSHYDADTNAQQGRLDRAELELGDVRKRLKLRGRQ